MRRILRVLIMVGLVGLGGLGLWLVWRNHQRSAVSPAPAGSVQSVVSNAVESAKMRFTGGVGVLLRPDNGRVLIQGVGVGSPAEAAGLQVGDVLLQINGQSTTGMPLMQVAQSMRGFTGGRVELTVQRAGGSNVTCVIRRTSWNKLLGSTFNQTSGTNAPGPTAPAASAPAASAPAPAAPQPR